MAAVAIVMCVPQATARDARVTTNLLAEMLDNFNTRHPEHSIGLMTARWDVNDDGGEQELLLSSMDTTVVEIYDLKASRPGNLVRVPVEQVEQATLNEVYWTPFLYAYKQFNDLDYNTDITLRHRPLFASPNLQRNTFVAVLDAEDAGDIVYPNVYDNLIFKPHVNRVTHISKQGGNELLYKLDDPKVIKTMFRGYDGGEAAPVLVPHQFLETHNVLQFSRWKSPEPIQKLTIDGRSIIQNHYRGWRIADSRWLASCPSAERSFYAVTFEPLQGKALAAIVCIAEGSVASTIDFEGWIEDGNSYWFGDDDFFAHQPEIMAMMATELGFEMYVRWLSMEGTHYAIWREVLDKWVMVQDDYEYWY